MHIVCFKYTLCFDLPGIRTHWTGCRACTDTEDQGEVVSLSRSRHSWNLWPVHKHLLMFGSVVNTCFLSHRGAGARNGGWGSVRYCQ